MAVSALPDSLPDRADGVAAGTTLRALLLPVYLPIISSYLGFGVLIPVLPLYLTDGGLSLGAISAVLAAVGLGAALGSLPAGSLIARLGERQILVIALSLLAFSTALIGFTTAVVALVALRMAAGASSVGFRLSRQTFIARRVEGSRRGQAMALVGGSFRVALFIGPLVGGLLAETVGFTSTFAIAGLLSALGLIPGALAERKPLPPRPDLDHVRQLALGPAIRAHWRRLLLAGVVPLLVMTVREGRFVVLPLIGDELGLRPTAIGAVITVGTAADLLLFPAAGWIMDRFGRLFAMLPAFTLIAAGLVMLGLADGTPGVVAAGAVIGVGNGLSSGSMLTLGSDLAPGDSTAPFLAGVAAMQDGGRVAGPLLVGAVGGAAGLATASIVLAGVLVVAMLWLVVVVGETRHARV